MSQIPCVISRSSINRAKAPDSCRVITATLNNTVATAILGGEVEVPTIDGKVRIKIAPGTHAGKVLRLRGKGLPDINGYGRGDIKVIVDITIPTELTKEERELVEKLSHMPHFKQAEKLEKQNILERIKSFFRN